MRPRHSGPPPIVELTIESLDASGDGIATYQGEVVTIPFTIPGERVRARLGAAFSKVPISNGRLSGHRDGQRRGQRATLETVVLASPHRVAPRCRHFGPDAIDACGGCSWQHIAYPEQLRLKTATVERLLRAAVPTAPRPGNTLTATPVDTPWGFRNKAHFVFGSMFHRRSPIVTMGHLTRDSRRLVPVAECPVHEPRANDVAFALLDAFERSRATTLKGVAVRVAHGTSELVATLVVEHDRDQQLRAATKRFLGTHPDVPLHLNVHAEDDGYVFGPHTRRLAGPERMKEETAGVGFLVSPTAFFQTNVRAAELLVRLVLDAVPTDASVLDLYAGAGLFSLPLARRGHQVVAVEEHRAAVADGEASRRLNRIDASRCRFVCAPVERALASRDALKSFTPDVVILDPPRRGCGGDVIARVFGGHRPARAVYVSCDPQSLARDLTDVVRLGYTIRSVQPVDMFPHTPHIETVVVLDRQAD